MTAIARPELDLSISRLIAAPRETVWRAWTDPANFEQWWVPAPAKCRVIDFELEPGWSFRTEFDESGDGFVPQITGCFLAVDRLECIVFTTALVAGWRPAEQPFITAEITFVEHPAGTEYVSRVMHRNVADREMHEELGFYDGWGAVIGQLAAFVEHE